MSLFSNFIVVALRQEKSFQRDGRDRDVKYYTIITALISKIHKHIKSKIIKT